jgi:transposase-like protein
MLVPASSVCDLFKWRQFEPEVILLAVGWYLRFSLSYPISKIFSVAEKG